jgi:tetratricopeptide (TPR) repeat protein
MEYSLLEQERRSRGWSRAYVQENYDIPQDTLYDAERGNHEPNKSTIDALCSLYKKSAKELGLDKSGRIGVGIRANAQTNGEQPPMSDLIRREIFRNLGSRLTSLVDAWPKRNYQYAELQEGINRAILGYNAAVAEAPTYELTRRQAVKDMILVPMQLTGGIALISSGKAPKADTDLLLKHCAAGISACWYLRRGKELTFVSDAVSIYIFLLQPLIYSLSENYRKASATLLAQCFILKSKLANALQDDDQAITYEEEAIRYALMAEDITEQAIANREMSILYWGRKKYKLALPYAEKAYGLAKNNKATPKIIISFTASGLSFCQATCGKVKDAQLSLKEAHDLFDPTMLIPSVPYGEAVLTSVDANVYRHMGKFKEAIERYQHLNALSTTVLGPIENNIEYAATEVSRDDKPRDMSLCITLLTDAITGATELDSQWYIREAHEVFDLFRIAWPREDAIKRLGRDYFGLN